MRTILQTFSKSLLERSSVLGWIIISMGFMTIILVTSGCSGDDDPAADPRKAIETTWTLATGESVVKDEEDVSDEYTNLSITFSPNGTYTAQNAKHLFKTSGTWTWQGTSTTQLMRDGDFDITVVSLTATSLQLQFVMDPDDVSGRIGSLTGEYIIKLKAAQ